MIGKTIVSAFVLSLTMLGCVSGPNLPCDEGLCQCVSGDIIHEEWICDGDNDCGDDQDEDGCPDQDRDRRDSRDRDDDPLDACWDCSYSPCRLYYARGC